MNKAIVSILIRVVRKHGLAFIILAYLGYLGLKGKIEFSYPRPVDSISGR